MTESHNAVCFMQIFRVQPKKMSPKYTYSLKNAQVLFRQNLMIFEISEISFSPAPFSL